MDEENFYIHLNSNVSDIIRNPFCNPIEETCEQSRNRIGNFVNRLAKRLVLKGSWEVALTNLQYRKSWLNVHQDQPLWLADIDGNLIPLDENLPAGNYVTVSEMIEKLNQIYSNFLIRQNHIDDSIDFPPLFIYKRYSNSIRIRLGEKDSTNKRQRYLIPRLSKYLAKYLGLSDVWDLQYPEANNEKFKEIIGDTNVRSESPTEPISSSEPKSGEPVIIELNKPHNQSQVASKANKGKKWKKLPKHMRKDGEGVDYNVDILHRYIDAFKEVSLHGPIDTLYIYCSLIKPTIIANVEAPLIRRVAVPSDSQFGDLCEADYISKEYYPLLYNEIDKIEIDIKGDSGETVDFKFGKVALTLHFRKRFNYGF